MLASTELVIASPWVFADFLAAIVCSGVGVPLGADPRGQREKGQDKEKQTKHGGRLAEMKEELVVGEILHLFQHRIL